MKPVVTSLMALALAITPAFALATPDQPVHEKAPTTKVVHHHGHKGVHRKRVEKVAKIDKSEKIEKIDTSDTPSTSGTIEKPALVRVSHVTHARKHSKHHPIEAHAGEPGPDEATIVQASLTKKPKLVRASARSIEKAPELPALPDPTTVKSHKHGAEKGARKATPKKHGGEAKDDGQPGRDEELAELVAQIRGKKPIGDARASEKRCLKEPVEMIRGPEKDSFSLATCDGEPAPLAAVHLSVVIRSGGAARPEQPLAELAKNEKGSEIAPGIRHVASGLTTRLEAVADHFVKHGTAKIDVVSGYRPMSLGSKHSLGRAIDFRLEGVTNEDLVAFCKTLEDTGCGYYPNSSFVHMDVRDPGTGHVSWIDVSGPGEKPHYVTSWPLRDAPTASPIRSGLLAGADARLDADDEDSSP